MIEEPAISREISKRTFMGDPAPHNASAATPLVGPSRRPSSEFIAITLGSIGVVYGDIGTSPLYAFREAALAAAEHGPLTRATVLGVLSLILWALIVVVTLKYVLILLRGERFRSRRWRPERSAAAPSLSSVWGSSGPRCFSATP